MNKLNFLIFNLSIFFVSCSAIAPGIQEPNSRHETVYIEEIDQKIPIIEINNELLNNLDIDYVDTDYKIDVGDVLT
ncbi:MAG: hypothetical protein VW298_01940, partial [Candidatus Woesearchaeota archaeon]